RSSKPPGSECCVRRRQRRTRSVHSWCVGCGSEPRSTRGSGDCLHGRTQHERCRYARHCRPAGVEGHITRKRIALEPGRSHVWPSPADADGPHREGEEPEPMMHGRGKSDSAIVAVKPVNNAEQSAAELVERRAETKGNANQQSTRRTQSRISVSQ